jgi:hypothetical protein
VVPPSGWGRDGRPGRHRGHVSDKDVGGDVVRQHRRSQPR